MVAPGAGGPAQDDPEHVNQPDAQPSDRGDQSGQHRVFDGRRAVLAAEKPRPSRDHGSSASSSRRDDRTGRSGRGLWQVSVSPLADRRRRPAHAQMAMATVAAAARITASVKRVLHAERTVVGREEPLQSQ